MTGIDTGFVTDEGRRCDGIVRIDRGREAVYAAEESAVAGTDLDEPRPLGELCRVAAAVVSGDWWRAAGGPVVTVGAARTGTTSSRTVAAVGARDGVPVVVRLAPGQWSVATVAHELAHALAGVEHGHDGRFRAAHVDLVAMVGGAGPAAALTASYADHRVPAGPRAWPPPVRATGTGFVIVP